MRARNSIVIVTYSRDIHRTFPDHDMFKDRDGEGQMALFRILKAYSIYDSTLGFCQGMPFCVGPLLMQSVSFYNSRSPKRRYLPYLFQ